MRIQAAIGIILTLLGMVGMGYCAVAIFDETLPQTPTTGIVVVAFFSFYVGTLILRRIIESL